MKGVRGRPPVGVQVRRSERKLGTGKLGRPPAVHYDNSIATKVAALIADGQSITNISHMKGMPVRSTLMRWYRDELDFKRLVDIAVVDRADYYLDKIIDIFDKVEKGKMPIDKARFLVDQWKWVLLKMHPKFEEGRKTQTENTAVQFKITLSEPKKMGTLEVINPLQIGDSQDAEISIEEEREVGEGYEKENDICEDAQLWNNQGEVIAEKADKDTITITGSEQSHGITSDGCNDETGTEQSDKPAKN